MGWGGMDTHYGLGPQLSAVNGDYAWTDQQFSSQHRGVTNFVFADGSVHSFRWNADRNTLDNMSSYINSEPVDLSAVL
jgi:prepilin-type processing-associated H-X9-DG protein